MPIIRRPAIVTWPLLLWAAALGVERPLGAQARSWEADLQFAERLARPPERFLDLAAAVLLPLVTDASVPDEMRARARALTLDYLRTDAAATADLGAKCAILTTAATLVDVPSSKPGRPDLVQEAALDAADARRELGEWLAVAADVTRDDGARAGLRRDSLAALARAEQLAAGVRAVVAKSDFVRRLADWRRFVRATILWAATRQLATQVTGGDPAIRLREPIAELDRVVFDNENGEPEQVAAALFAAVWRERLRTAIGDLDGADVELARVLGQVRWDGPAITPPVKNLTELALDSLLRVQLERQAFAAGVTAGNEVRRHFQERKLEPGRFGRDALVKLARCSSGAGDLAGAAETAVSVARVGTTDRAGRDAVAVLIDVLRRAPALVLDADQAVAAAVNCAAIDPECGVALGRAAMAAVAADSRPAEQRVTRMVTLGLRVGRLLHEAGRNTEAADTLGQAYRMGFASRPEAFESAADRASARRLAAAWIQVLEEDRAAGRKDAAPAFDAATEFIRHHPPPTGGADAGDDRRDQAARLDHDQRFEEAATAWDALARDEHQGDARTRRAFAVRAGLSLVRAARSAADARDLARAMVLATGARTRLSAVLSAEVAGAAAPDDRQTRAIRADARLGLAEVDLVLGAAEGAGHVERWREILEVLVADDFASDDRPRSAAFHHFRGRALIELGRLDEAEGEFSAIAQADPAEARLLDLALRLADPVRRGAAPADSKSTAALRRRAVYYRLWLLHPLCPKAADPDTWNAVLRLQLDAGDPAAAAALDRVFLQRNALLAHLASAQVLAVRLRLATNLDRTVDDLAAGGADATERVKEEADAIEELLGAPGGQDLLTRRDVLLLRGRALGGRIVPRGETFVLVAGAGDLDEAMRCFEAVLRDASPTAEEFETAQLGLWSTNLVALERGRLTRSDVATRFEIFTRAHPFVGTKSERLFKWIEARVAGR